MNRFKTALHRMQSCRLRLTQTRRLLLERFAEARTPLSYEHFNLQEAMDKTTFYRNMQRFEQAGLVRKIESDDRRWYFELALDEHAHFICDCCHRVECLTEVPAQVPNGYRVESIIFKGQCPSCSPARLQ